MQAMVLKKQKFPLVLEDIPKPIPKESQLLIKVHACGVCRTDLHIQDGDLQNPKLPLILGHEVVGVVEDKGKNVQNFQIGDRVGVPWLGYTCDKCEYCKQGKENLCDNALYTGYNVDGGFAEFTTCEAEFAIPLPHKISDQNIAPLLCAGLIGFRSYRKAAANKTLGFYGFGVAAHLLTQLAVQQNKKVYAFTREKDTQSQGFAKKLGASWAGGSNQFPPELLDAAIMFAPVGELVPKALKALKKGGKCVCGGIHMSDIPSFPYKDLWGEKSIESVANLTRQDAKDYFSLLTKITVKPEVISYHLEQANEALKDFKSGKLQGAAVLKISSK